MKFLKFVGKGIISIIIKPLWSFEFIKTLIFNKLFGYILSKKNISIIFHHKKNIDIVMSGKGNVVEMEIINNTFEDYLVNFYNKNLKENNVFFDVGSNIGLFSLIASKKINKGKIYAFDADINMLNLLEKSIKINSINNVKIENKAIGDKQGFINFNIVKDPAFNSIGEVEGHELIKQIKIPMITLDDFVYKNNITNLDFVKIDIEGNELNALKGFAKTLKTLKPILSIEISEQTFSYFNYSSRDLLEFMKEKGYEVYNYKNNVLEKEIIKQEYLYDNLIFIPNDFDISQIK